jgi:hypothetical protein
MSRNGATRLYPVRKRRPPGLWRRWSSEASRAAGDRNYATEYDVYRDADLPVWTPTYVSKYHNRSGEYVWIGPGRPRRKRDINPA